MNHRKLFYSKKFFIFNIMLVGVIAGFVVAFLLFGSSGSIKSGDSVQAQEVERIPYSSDEDWLKRPCR